MFVNRKMQSTFYKKKPNIQHYFEVILCKTMLYNGLNKWLVIKQLGNRVNNSNRAYFVKSFIRFSHKFKTK